MIILPSQPRRAWLVSFWLTICVFSGLILGAFLALFVSYWWSALGLILAFVMALPGLLRPEAISMPYDLWNRVSRTFARGARLLLMGICYNLIFVAVGWTGSSLKLSRSTSPGSLWQPRRSLSLTTYLNQYDSSAQALHSKSWVCTYLSWATHSHNWWALSLLPFLLLLSTFDEETQGTFPANIYTLF